MLCAMCVIFECNRARHLARHLGKICIYLSVELQACIYAEILGNMTMGVESWVQCTTPFLGIALDPR
jgi:hypothetical protein